MPYPLSGTQHHPPPALATLLDAAPELSARHVAALGVAQTLGWASSYYLPAVLAVPMARELGVSVPTVYAAVSAALVVSAFAGPPAGRAIDRLGGRPVLIVSNLLFALGLAMLALVQEPFGTLGLLAGWAVIGLAMGSGLYEAAFATLVRLQGQRSRRAITGITLIAGFASTVGWPLSALMESQVGWRGACLGWAALHLLLGLPLNASLPHAPAQSHTPEAHDLPDAQDTAPAASAVAQAAAKRHSARTAALLAIAFAVTWFTSTAMANHLPRLLQAAGATLPAAIFAGALIGPAQVVARLLEFSLLRRAHPLLSARLAALAHPVGAAALIFLGAPAAAAFALVHGAGNGILTIANGTLPLSLFGPHGYGRRQGWLMLPARIAQALAPLAFGLALDQWGVQVLWLSGGLGLAGFLSLMFIRKTAAH